MFFITAVNEKASDSLSQEAIIGISANIINECQAGNVSASLNISGACETVSVPASSASDSGATYSTPSLSRLVFHTEATAHFEGKTLRTQPTIQAVDAQVRLLQT